MAQQGCKMTRKDAKQAIFNGSKEDTSSPNNCIHLLSLHRFIDEIYDDFEEHVDDLRDTIETYMEQAAMYRNLYEKQNKQHEEELKKAYIEGGNDVWKALNCNELAK